MISTSKLLCLFLVGVMVAQLACGQTQPSSQAKDELQFRGNEATSEDTKVITDPTPTNNQQQQNNQNELVQPTSVDFDNNDDDDDTYNYNQQQQQNRPSSPFNFLMPFGFGFGSSFGGSNNGGRLPPPPPHGRPPFGRPPSSLLGGLFGGDLFDQFDRHAQEMERQFSSLEKQAAEGEEVQYFQRNGEAYVRTCSTRKVRPGEQQQQQHQQQQQLRDKSQLLQQQPTIGPKTN